MLEVLEMYELPVFQNGSDFLQKVFCTIVPLRNIIQFVATRQTTAEDPGPFARLDTVSHSSKKTGVAGKIEASNWTRRS